MENTGSIECECPTRNEVVFPKVTVFNMSTFRNGDYQTQLKQLKVHKPKNFVFKDVPVEKLRSLKSFFEDEYIKSIKERFLENMFLTGTYYRKKQQEENATLFHQLYSLLDDHIRVVEKICDMKKRKRRRYRRNKSMRKRRGQYFSTSGFRGQEDMQRNFFHVEISPIKY